MIQILRLSAKPAQSAVNGLRFAALFLGGKGGALSKRPRLTRPDGGWETADPCGYGKGK
jgi:hypothetical protein